MNIKISLITIILLSSFAFGNVFNYEQKLSDIVPNMPKLKDVTSKFSQDKYIPNSNIHLKSSGDFKFEKNKGVTFYTTYPIKSTISYSNHEYRQINAIIQAIANKNYSKLEQDFKFYFLNDNSTWTLGLKPKKNSKIVNYIESIEISGKIYISKIIITTFDKTVTTISFSNVKEVR